MWRVIVRISFFHDQDSRLRNHIVPLLRAMGLSRTRTGTWESDAVDPAEAAMRTCQVFQALGDARSVAGVDPLTELSHLWIYIDRVEEA